MRTCTKCGAPKALEAFAKASKTSGSPDGRRAMCKACTNEAGRTIYRGNDTFRARKNALARQWWKAKSAEDPFVFRVLYWASDKEAAKARSRAWYERNKMAQRARALKWAKENRVAMRALRVKRRMVAAAATPGWLSAIERGQIQEVYDIADARSMQTGVLHHVDHVIPLRGRGFNGLHVPWNLQPLVAELNIAKNNRPQPEHEHFFWKAA